MKGINKYKRILILMVTSQLLLTLFVLYWLRSQYRSERESLLNELTGFYIDTQDEILDTLLFNTYVNPVLSVKRKSISQHFITLRDSVEHDSLFLKMPESNEDVVRWKDRKGGITVRVEHGLDSAALFPDTIKIRRMNEDVLLRSIKLVVSHTRDSLGKEEPVTGYLSMKPDTGVFKVHFNNRIAGAGMNFNLLWEVSKESSAQKRDRNILYLNPVNPFSLPAVMVTHYNKYLGRKILPQVFFGFFLIFVTALAFGLSYRSIRDHIVMNDLRNEFISNITHELKTPVATLSIALESLGKFNMRDEPGVTDEFLRLASLETKRLEDLISRILDHSLLEENSRSLNTAQIDINSIISEVTGIMKPRLMTGGTIEFLPSEEKLTVPGDQLFLKGVLINLVDNSIKYCDKVPAIRIISSKYEGFAVIEVCDNGPGIPVEYQKKIFEKFYRLPTGNIHNVKGYGLGLSFAALVMKLHKGTISVKNNDQGCSFILKIPVT